MKDTQRFSPKKIFEALLPWAVLAFLISYTYALLYVVPYIGFQYGSKGDIIDIYISQVDGNNLLLNDQIYSINQTTWNDFKSNPRLRLFEGMQPDEVVSIEVARNGVRKTINWKLPGFNSNEFNDRLLNIWIPSYAFWVGGVATQLLVRPRDERRTLLIAMNYVSAIWLMAGSLSQQHMWESHFVMRAALWMSMPIYLHLHWNFPKQMRSLPKGVWKALYVLAALGAALQWMQLLPRKTYILPFLLGLVGSVVIMTVRFFLRPSERREIVLLVLAVLVAFAPVFAIVVASAQQSLTPFLPGLLFSMLALPGAYFYVVYRRQLGGLEFRANRLLSLYLFLVLLLTAIFAFLSFLPDQLFTARGLTGVIMGSVLLSALVTVLGFSRFQRFVERNVLNMPMPPEHLLEIYARKISTSITRENLVRVLKLEVLPSLLVRQSALIQIQEEKKPEVLFAVGLENSQIPDSKEINDLLQQSKQGKSFATRLSTDSGVSDWIRLHFPLVVGEEVQGLWLLGRRDPDDYYSQAEINILAALADQTAIALTNVSQAKRLRDLYQMDIDQQEIERAHLARELHDDVLNRMAELVMLLDDETYTAEFEQQYRQLVDYLRTTIHGLRPPMLSYGLHAALRELTEDVAQRAQNAITIKFEVPSTDARFDPKVEQHLYRIIQQAVENALRHAEPKSITISGYIQDNEIDLQVSDDGRGFELETGLDLVQLLATRHFGLAGMSERAALVGAELDIETAPGKGTSIRLLSRFEDSA